MLSRTLIQKLRTSTMIPQVILFGTTTKMPSVPYVVVKEENGGIEDTKQFRIIAHHNSGYNDFIREYIEEELTDLLISYEGKKVRLVDDEDGGIYQFNSGDWTGIMTEPDDSTIYMERVVFLPHRF